MSDSNLLKELEALLHKLVIQAGWPAEIMAALRVEITDDGADVTYSDTIKEQVHDLEYGFFEVPPRPAIRKFKELASEMVTSGQLEKTLDDTLLKGDLL